MRTSLPWVLKWWTKAVAGIVMGVLASSSVSSANWDTDLSLSIREVYSDNIELDEGQGVDDFVTDITPRLLITGEGKQLKLQLDYAIQSLFYAQESDRDRTNHQANARIESELIEDLFLVEASGRASQQLGDIREGFSRDRISGAGNFDDVLGYTVTPILLPKLGDFASARLAYTRDYVESDNSSGRAFNNSEGDSFEAAMTNGSATGELFWNINYVVRDIQFDQGDFTDTELLRGRAGFNISQAWSLFATGTYEDNQFVGNRGNAQPDDSSFGGGLTWRPNSRFQVSAAYNKRTDPRPDEDENFMSGDFSWLPSSRTEMTGSFGSRFFGDTYNLRFSHEMRRSSWQVSYTENVSDFRQSFLAAELVGGQICPVGSVDPSECRLLDPNQPVRPGERIVPILEITPSITENTFISKDTNAAWTVRGGKNVITFGSFLRKREFVGDGNNEEDLSFSLSWVHEFGRRTSANVTGRYTDREFDDGETSEEYTIQFILQRLLGADTAMSFEVQYTDRDSGRGFREFTESRGVLSLNHSF